MEFLEVYTVIIAAVAGAVYAGYGGCVHLYGGLISQELTTVQNDFVNFDGNFVSCAKRIGLGFYRFGRACVGFRKNYHWKCAQDKCGKQYGDNIAETDSFHVILYPLSFVVCGTRLRNRTA